MSDVKKEVQTTFGHIKLEEIHEPDEALRKVDKANEKYQGLVESVRLKGVITPITVRKLVDPETNKNFYGLVDGLQRFSASKDVGKETVPCHIIEVADGELLEAQIIANVHKIETRPVEYSKALLKLLMNNPLISRTDLANRLAKTTSWISERLGLLKLTEDIGKLVDEDKIGLSNAYALAKLPVEEQTDFVDRAMTMPPQQFAPTVNARVKEIRDANRKGRDAGPVEFKPIPLIRSRAEMVMEMEKPSIGIALCKGNNLTTANDGFAMGVKWVLNLDPVSAEIQKAKDVERRAEKDRANEKSKVERKRKRAKEAAEKATKLQKEADDLEKKEKKEKAEKAATS